MFVGLPLTVTEVGRFTTLSVDTTHYRYQYMNETHTCKYPRTLRVDDVVVVDKGPMPNMDVQVKHALKRCGDECTFFLYDLVP